MGLFGLGPGLSSKLGPELRKRAICPFLTGVLGRGRGALFQGTWWDSSEEARLVDTLHPIMDSYIVGNSGGDLRLLWPLGAG